MPGTRGRPRHRRPRHRRPPQQHLGSVLREQKAAAGREGGNGGSGSRGPALLRAARLLRGRGAGANFLLPTAPKMTVFKKKSGGKKKTKQNHQTNTAEQPLRPDAEFLSPLICLLFAFVSGRRRPAERDPGGRAAREAGSPLRGRRRRKALSREAERQPQRAPGPAAGPALRGGGEPGTAGAAGGRGPRPPRSAAAPLPAAPQPLPVPQPKSHAASCA